MGFMGICIDFLAWPLVALGYPMFASIRAIETGSKHHMRKLVTYWTLFSLIYLFEFAFGKIVEWIPCWSTIKFMLTLWLVMPQFDGALLAYESLIRPCLSVDLEAVIYKFYKPKEEQPRKTETFLDIAEKYIDKHGSEALEKLISSKRNCKEPDNSQRDIQVLEQEEKIAAATSEHLEEPDAAQTANEMLEATEKCTSTEAKGVQVRNAPSATAALVPKVKDVAAEAKEMTQPEAAWAQKENDTAADIKELTQPESTAENRSPGVPPQKKIQPEPNSENRPHEVPPQKKIQQEWICDLCQVKATSEKMLNDHLRGSKHRSNCESLKTSKLQAEGAGSSSTSNQGNPEAVKSKAGEGSKQQSPKKTPSDHQKQGGGAANQQYNFWCNVCNVKLLSDVDLASHLKGKRHASNIENMLKMAAAGVVS